MNPAREYEQIAVATVSAWLGKRGVVTHLGKTGDVDFEITYEDTRYAVGEVGWHEDPQIQEMWANTLKRPRHQVIPLAADRGVWSVGLRAGANIAALYRRLPAFIDRLVERGDTWLDVDDYWPKNEVGQSARTLGIEHISLANADGDDLAIFFMPGSGGVVPTDPNVIVDWAEHALTDEPDYEDTTAKLLAREADERHVFLVSGTRTPFGADERLRRIDQAIPSRPVSLPIEITHLWLMPQYGPAVALLWQRSAGWSAVPIVVPPA